MTHSFPTRRLSDLLIGLQTESVVQRFRDYVLREAGGSADGDRLSADGRTVVAKAFPIGIDAEQFAEMTASDEARKDAARLKAAIFNRVQIIGVDRLDYTKRSEEHTSELQSLMRISYAVFCLKKKKKTRSYTTNK